MTQTQELSLGETRGDRPKGPDDWARLLSVMLCCFKTGGDMQVQTRAYLPVCVCACVEGRLSYAWMVLISTRDESEPLHQYSMREKVLEAHEPGVSCMARCLLQVTHVWIFAWLSVHCPIWQHEQEPVYVPINVFPASAAYNLTMSRYMREQHESKRIWTRAA